MDLEIDGTGVEDIGLRCPEGCAYCCLCPPGLLEEEVETVVEACSSREEMEGPFPGSKVGIPGEIGLQGGWGACSFLRDGRCTIYESRPHFCRQYPLLVYSGWRLQLSVIRSCRGLVHCDNSGFRDDGGHEVTPLMDIFRDEMEALGKEYFLDTLTETRESFEELRTRCSVHAPVETVNRIAMTVVRNFGKAREMADLLEMTTGDEEVARKGLLARCWPTISDTFTLKDVIDMPVYNNRELEWRIFMLEEEMDIDILGCCKLGEDGDIEPECGIPLEALMLKDLTAGARKVMTDYLQLALGRDVFYGMVAREALVEERPMGEVALEMGSVIGVDLWWRGGLLSVFHRMREMGEDMEVAMIPDTVDGRMAHEAVMFMDADLLDSFALGAII